MLARCRATFGVTKNSLASWTEASRALPLAEPLPVHTRQA